MALKQITVAVVLTIVSLGPGLSDAVAHPGHSHSHSDRDKTTTSSTPSTNRHHRTWTVQENGRQIDASILLSKDGQLRLEQPDGSVVTVPLRDLTESDRLWAERQLHEIRLLNTQPATQLLALQTGRRDREPTKPSIASLFDPFRKHVQVRWDDDFLYVESDGMPDHPMMIGITAWQQQVPLPQQYTGNNAWRIPLNPVPARKPMSAKTGFFRGAIAIAVNGIPIFNPIKNDGKTDTLTAGELDQWGGHCGRADDYHYHIAPVHLEKIVGKGKPVGFALDGYPIYGYADEDASTPKDLDWLNGHKDSDGNYHYHATKTYPYLNGGFYGEVIERDGQVDPQPRARGVRPSLTGLRGAKITGFENPKPNSFKVEYDVYGDKRSVSYDVADNGSAVFRFTDSDGTRTEEYQPRQGGGRGGPGGRQDGQAGRPEDRGGSQPERQPQENRPQGEGRRPPGGGGDPLMRAFDTNRDGAIDRAELAKAVEVLKSLDKNGDGRLTSDEMRGGRGRGSGGRGQGGGERGQGRRPNRPEGDRPGGGVPQGQAGGPRGPQPGDGPRQPWILVHADEVDLNEDGIISRDEIVGEAEKAFGGYDANKDGELSESELNAKGNVRSAMGGFIRGHAKELDRDEDGVLTRKETVDNATRMFARIDSNGDGKITKTELDASRRTGDAPSGQQGRRGGQDKGQAEQGKGGGQRKGPGGGQGKGQGGPRRGGGDNEPQDQPRARDSQSGVERKGGAGGQRKGNNGGGSRLGGYETPPPANNVPAHLFNIVMGRLTDRSVTLRVLFHENRDGEVTYGTKGDESASKTKPVQFKAGQPVDVVLDSLAANKRYYYRLVFRKPGEDSNRTSDEFTFHTQRAAGSSFTFTVQADSHLDENTSGEVYLRTLANALADQPDFHFGLGDTFMTGKYVRPELSHPQYLAQRYYLGHLCHSAAFFFALGNHDGEAGNRGSNLWATTTRKRYFPNPMPDGFYTGNNQRERGIGLPENYYQFHWGNCQFIVLDPFRYTTTRNRGGDTKDNWFWTLGEKQYQWLRKELADSDATFRFVFLHHLVGGSDRNSRGGAEAAPFWEWGGTGISGEYEFDKRRSGWGKPIHQLLVEHGASVVFHGHDHMFIKQDLDGVVYQLVPQPGHPRSGTKSATEYGYLGGEIQGSSGHVRVRVNGDSARVDYVRAYLPKAESSGRMNGEVSYSYQLEQ